MAKCNICNRPTYGSTCSHCDNERKKYEKKLEKAKHEKRGKHRKDKG